MRLMCVAEGYHRYNVIMSLVGMNQERDWQVSMVIYSRKGHVTMSTS